MDIGKTAMFVLEAKAADLRKREPHLTREQAFAKIYSDPANSALAKAERAANGFRYPPVARTEPAVAFGEKDAIAELQKLAAEFRRDHPFLTPEQAFARVYADPSNSAIARREREQARAALGM